MFIKGYTEIVHWGTMQFVVTINKFINLKLDWLQMVLNAGIYNGGNFYEKLCEKYVEYLNNKLISRIVCYYQPNLTQHLRIYSTAMGLKPKRLTKDFN